VPPVGEEHVRPSLGVEGEPGTAVSPPATRRPIRSPDCRQSRPRVIAGHPGVSSEEPESADPPTPPANHAAT
jgi:hypothetical protein